MIDPIAVRYLVVAHQRDLARARGHRDWASRFRITRHS
jgi:hypothetical protein